ncbi:hypothetical protein LJC71_09205 [Desulfosarcina sp. OttesenSCG-928-A07]|nr:hypothetical protein [Desulfosarcina sp. OttesenSCG-928-G17]MDL2329900.1 hypothetical protein [Desulfosarcina sp. OttesenSCG-928-A07]
MILQEGMLQFDFAGAVDAFKFDEQDRALATYHGLSHCMKAVDFVVEYPDHYLFVEIKDPKNSNRYGSAQDKLTLIKNLTTKFRDTFLYRWAENQLDKPVRYQCLVELDNAQTLYLMNQLKNQLPTNKHPARWQRPLVHLCAVANQATWNITFPNIQINRVT